MLGHSNMRGFNHSLYKQTSYVNKVSFAEGVSHGEEFSFLEQVRNQAADCILIVGSNPLLNLPHSVSKNLKGIPIICLDPFVTSTTRAAQVVLGVAISGLEAGGKAMRMDGEEVALLPAKMPTQPSDEEILSQLLDKVSQ
jgi:formylmethanofuran dehydrogenase subunit B